VVDAEEHANPGPVTEIGEPTVQLGEPGRRRRERGDVGPRVVRQIARSRST